MNSTFAIFFNITFLVVFAVVSSLFSVAFNLWGAFVSAWGAILVVQLGVYLSALHAPCARRGHDKLLFSRKGART